jgi:hypothetical protein
MCCSPAIVKGLKAVGHITNALIMYAWVEFGYPRKTEHFEEDDDEKGIVDKLAMSIQSCILDHTDRPAKDLIVKIVSCV